MRLAWSILTLIGSICALVVSLDAFLHGDSTRSTAYVALALSLTLCETKEQRR